MPVIKWQRSFKKLPVNRYVVYGDTLTIKNTIEDDEGAYFCEGGNELETVRAAIFVFVIDEGETVNPTPTPYSTPPPRLKKKSVFDEALL